MTLRNYLILFATAALATMLAAAAFRGCNAGAQTAHETDVNAHHNKLHAATHSKAGEDEVRAENLATASVDTGLALKPNGLGGVAFGTVTAAGTAVVLDLADDGVNESTAVTELATTGDANTIATEPAPDKLLLNLGKVLVEDGSNLLTADWPNPKTNAGHDTFTIRVGELWSKKSLSLLDPFYHTERYASPQAAWDALCAATAGIVKLPEAVTLTSTLNLTCPQLTGLATPTSTTYNKLLAITGPSVVTCNTGTTPCIRVFGPATSPGWMSWVHVSSLRLVGPGKATAGSIGLQIDGKVLKTRYSSLTIQHFDKGVRAFGSAVSPTGAVHDTVLRDIVVGMEESGSSAGTATVNIGFELVDDVANFKVRDFSIDSFAQAILETGAPGSGPDASFVGGTFNSCAEAALATGCIDIRNANGTLLQDIELEGRPPLMYFDADVGSACRANVVNVRFFGNTANSDSPAITNVDCNLRIADSLLVEPTGVTLNPEAILVQGGITSITGNEITGSIKATGGSRTTITGNSAITDGVWLNGVSNVTIAGNNIQGPNGNALRIQGTSANVTVSGNQLSNWNPAASAFQAIEVVAAGTQDNITITGNVIHSPANSTPDGIKCSATAGVDETVVGNTYRGGGIPVNVAVDCTVAANNTDAD